MEEPYFMGPFPPMPIKNNPEHTFVNIGKKRVQNFCRKYSTLWQLVLVSFQFIRKNTWLVELCLDILWDFVLLNYYLCLFFALKEKKSCKHQRTFWLAIFNFYIFTYLINDGKLHNELETFGFIYQKRVALSVLLHTSAKKHTTNW